MRRGLTGAGICHFPIIRRGDVASTMHEDWSAGVSTMAAAVRAPTPRSWPYSSNLNPARQPELLDYHQQLLEEQPATNWQHTQQRPSLESGGWLPRAVP